MKIVTTPWGHRNQHQHLCTIRLGISWYSDGGHSPCNKHGNTLPTSFKHYLLTCTTCSNTFPSRLFLPYVIASIAPNATKSPQKMIGVQTLRSKTGQSNVVQPDSLALLSWWRPMNGKGRKSEENISWRYQKAMCQVQLHVALAQAEAKAGCKIPSSKGSLAYLHWHRNPSGTTDYGSCNLVSPIRHHRQSSQSTSFLRFKWDESEKDLARWNTRALASVSMPKDTMPGMYSSQSLCILSPSAIHKWPIAYSIWSKYLQLHSM